ncbi:hypothetical protein T06_7695 [Trichinella sp. T6]|nr:hypothetical protein T06_7695 [Trichinella sp. T6]
MSGRYTILYGWRKWRTGLQFSMGGRGIGVPVKNSVKVDGIEELCRILCGWREKRASGGNLGWVENSLWMEEGEERE